MAPDNNPHSGHRSRMKEKYLRFGAEAFTDHELLEMLLFYSIPRSDTNETAHRLIEKFGSLEKCLSSEIDQIKTVEGIGQNSAIFLSLIGDIFTRVNKKPLRKKKKYKTLSDVGEFLTYHYSGAKKEYFSALYFNSSMELIDVSIISEGSLSEAAVSPTRIAREAVLKDSTGVIVAHNHINDCPLLSSDDRRLTNLIEVTLAAINVPLLEHIIVTPTGYAPSMHLRFGTPAVALTQKAFGEDFHKKFYNI